MSCQPQKLSSFLAFKLFILQNVQILNFVHILRLNASHPSNLLVTRRRRFNSLLGVFLMFFQNFALRFQIGFPHFRKIADLNVGILGIRQKKRNMFARKLSPLQPDANFVPLLDLHNLHLIK
jgi:hypothetical protein